MINGTNFMSLPIEKPVYAIPQLGWKDHATHTWHFTVMLSGGSDRVLAVQRRWAQFINATGNDSLRRQMPPGAFQWHEDHAADSKSFERLKEALMQWKLRVLEALRTATPMELRNRTISLPKLAATLLAATLSLHGCASTCYITALQAKELLMAMGVEAPELDDKEYYSNSSAKSFPSLWLLPHIVLCRVVDKHRLTKDVLGNEMPWKGVVQYYTKGPGAAEDFKIASDHDKDAVKYITYWMSKVD
jgi:hypothetical protein